MLERPRLRQEQHRRVTASPMVPLFLSPIAILVSFGAKVLFPIGRGITSVRGCPTQQPVQAHAVRVACWMALFLGVLTAASTPSASAQDTSMSQEAKTRLGKEELRRRLQGGERIQDFTIQGDDLIAILRERTLDPTVEITIKNSVIEGGLDFTTLPATPLEQAELPEFWSDTDSKTWTAQ
jgi:hypothetical protein